MSAVKVYDSDFADEQTSQYLREAHIKGKAVFS
jgi:hypothetical protein